jgi:hypothetical protein
MWSGSGSCWRIWRRGCGTATRGRRLGEVIPPGTKSEWPDSR